MRRRGSVEFLADSALALCAGLILALSLLLRFLCSSALGGVADEVDDGDDAVVDDGDD